MAQAFDGLIRLLLGKSERELARFRDALRDALGSNGQLKMVGKVCRLPVNTQRALQ